MLCDARKTGWVHQAVAIGNGTCASMQSKPLQTPFLFLLSIDFVKTGFAISSQHACSAWNHECHVCAWIFSLCLLVSLWAYDTNKVMGRIQNHAWSPPGSFGALFRLHVVVVIFLFLFLFGFLFSTSCSLGLFLRFSLRRFKRPQPSPRKSARVICMHMWRQSEGRALPWPGRDSSHSLPSSLQWRGPQEHLSSPCRQVCSQRNSNMHAFLPHSPCWCFSNGIGLMINQLCVLLPQNLQWLLNALEEPLYMYVHACSKFTCTHSNCMHSNWGACSSARLLVFL